MRHLTSNFVVIIAIVVGIAGGCANYSVIPDDARARLNEAHEGELLYVKQSLYAGRFYDDDRYRLVHPRRFEELTYLLNAEGEAIAPPPADEIIPAGTRVRIERMEWPEGDAVFRRPLYTPRYTTWMYLRVARGTGSEVTMERNERHVLLLPGGIDDESMFNAWFQAALSSTDPTPWLRTLSDTQRVAIAQKKPAKGMTYEALTSALGFPDRISQRQQDGAAVEVGTWGALSVVLRDGLVESWSSPSSSSPPSEPSPSEASPPPSEPLPPPSEPAPSSVVEGI
jgi:hypothetical protein